MLILTRRVNETLNIGDDIQVTVLGVKGNQVRIGIDAPRDVPVHREEIYQQIRRKKLWSQVKLSKKKILMIARSKRTFTKMMSRSVTNNRNGQIGTTI